MKIHKGKKIKILTIVLLLIFLLLIIISGDKKEEYLIKDSIKYSKDISIITLAGGCFWCIEAPFQEEVGVFDVISGYSGGLEEDAKYLKVIKGDTEHREAVQIKYDPSVISTEEIISKFWAQIDPTDAGGQFADRGFQYTTAIFYHNPIQKKIAEESLKKLEDSNLFDQPVVTKILKFESFFEAEEYHQDYYKKSLDHYERYKKGSGRTGFIESEWAKAAAIEFLEDVQKPIKGDYDYTDEEIEEL